MALSIVDGGTSCVFANFNCESNFRNYFKLSSGALFLTTASTSIKKIISEPRKLFRLIMASENSTVKSGALVSLNQINPSSPFFLNGSSLRVVGKLLDYSVETGLATIVDEGANLKISTEHLRDLTFRVGSIYQFIGELHIQPGNEAVLQARVGRNVDGIDLNLYHQSLQLVRQFQAERMSNQTS